MPVVVATSIFFNRYLVPNYLLRNRKWKFGLYLLYMLIVSIYLELLVMVLAFVILADYEVANLGTIASDVYMLTLVLYLIVFAEGMVLAIQKLREKTHRLAEIEKQLEVEKQEEITIRSNRQHVLIKLKDIQYVESLGDYVRVNTEEKSFTTKEKISSFEERLPDAFVRIHRSFLINKNHVASFTKEQVVVGAKELSIGRKYKKSTEEALHANAIV